MIQSEGFPFYRYCMLPLLSLPHSLPRSPPLPSQRLDPPCYVVAMEQNKINWKMERRNRKNGIEEIKIIIINATKLNQLYTEKCSGKWEWCYRHLQYSIFDSSLSYQSVYINRPFLSLPPHSTHRLLVNCRIPIAVKHYQSGPSDSAGKHMRKISKTDENSARRKKTVTGRKKKEIENHG